MGRTALRFTSFLAAGLLAAACHQKERFVGGLPPAPFPQHGDLGGSSAAIAWRTDRPGSTIVEYGPTTSYGATVGNPGEKVLFHRATLTGLSASSLVHYRTKTLDDQNNTLYSYDRSLMTFPGSVTPGSYHRFDDDIEGLFAWIPQTYTDSQGVTSTVRDTTFFHAGSASLVMYCNAQGADANRSKGEVLLEASGANTKAGDGVSVEFQDMTGKLLSGFIFAPSAADGMVGNSNGIQLFVKDIYGGSQYGPYVNITGIHNVWAQLSMQVGGAGNAFTSPGFDPSLISTVGVKFGISSNVGPSITYTGPIYVDDVQVTP